MTAIQGGEPVNLASLLSLTGWGGRLLLLLFAATETTLMVTGGGQQDTAWQGILALVLMLAAASRTVLSRSYPLPLRSTIAVVVAVGLTAGLITSQLSTTGWPGYSAWHIGATMFVLISLSLRGRIGWAWVAMAILIAVTLGWATLTGQGILHGCQLIMRETGGLGIGTAYAVGIRRSAVRTTGLNEVRMRQAVEQSALRAAALERNAQVDELLETAGPALAAIASRSTPVDTDPAEYLVLEARLRDTIRARALAREPLTSIADAARRKGIDVVLFDDTNGATIAPDHLVNATEWIGELLKKTDHGTFTARIALDSGHPFVTVVEGDDSLRLDLNPQS